MKKWRFVFLSMIMIVMMSGCNHKSNAELVDVEQFRCQDSIETVFDVLGEGEFEEQETPFGTNYYYTYEDVNLFGYSGELVFSIKDDKRTINDFYCKLNLSNKEYEELLSYLSQKYGSYEVNDKWSYCTWEVSVEDGRIGYEDAEIGFDTISLQDNGNKKYTLFFKDEWSSINDEVYFEALEESQNSQTESSPSLVEGEYDICGDSVRLSIVPRDDAYEFMCYGTAKNKSNANVLTAMLYASCEKMKEGFGGYSVIVSYDNGGSIIIIWDGDSYSTMGVNEDGSAAFSKPDWFTGEDTMSESEFDEYVEALTNAFKDLSLELQNTLD